MNRQKVELAAFKRSAVNLNEDKVKDQLNRLCAKAVGKTLRNRGWTHFRPVWEQKANGVGYIYSATLKFQKTTKREYGQEALDKEWADIERKWFSGAKSIGWFKQTPDIKVLESPPKEDAPPPPPPEVNMPADVTPWFRHIFDRDAQILLIYAAIESAKASDFHKRNHCLLYGKPACGKTETLLSFVKMMGEAAVVKLDATATTKAGAENLLLEMETVPPILIIEEIEKCNPVNLPWLLGVLDQRGEIVKTNARVGSIRREARCLCLATVNNLPEFNTIMSGALASRFQHKIYFPRPTRVVLEQILAREVKEIGGKDEWIKPALDYCLDVEGTNDPRRVIAVLDGRDQLLSGEYQKDLDALRFARQADGVQD